MFVKYAYNTFKFQTKEVYLQLTSVACYLRNNTKELAILISTVLSLKEPLDIFKKSVIWIVRLRRHYYNVIAT